MFFVMEKTQTLSSWIAYLRSETNETPPIYVILMFFFTSPTKQSIDTPELYSVLLQSLLAD